MHSFLDMDSNHKYSTELLTAVLERDIESVQRYLQKGAKANVCCGADGHTAVGMAAALGEHEILRMLIQYCDDNRPPLPLAAQICSGFETDNLEHTPEGMDELEWDDEFPSEEDVEVEGLNIENDDINDDATTLYHYYAKTLEVTGSILNSIKIGLYAKDKRKDDPHVADESSMTPLHYAADYGHIKCVDILIESNCKMNPENDEGFTPLHLGTKFYDITLKLLKNGADPSLHSLSTNETALHMAVWHRSLKVVDLLLRHPHCCINAVNSDDRTPLMCAIRADACDIAMLLLDHKPRVNLADKKGRTALYYAVTRNKFDLAKRLLNCRARLYPEHYLLHSCVRMNLKEMSELLIMHGNDNSLSICNPVGHTPITLAIEYRNAEMLKHLLNINAKIKINCNNEHFYLGRELFLAVEFSYHLKDFKNLVNILFTYTKTTKTLTDDKEFECFDNFCLLPLAHAIEQNKLLFAEYLIKEGIDSRFACRKHSMMHLGQLCGLPGVLEFTRFLVYSGFKFELSQIPERAFWTPLYEHVVLELCKNPLPLKVLARLCIRRRLIQRPFGFEPPCESFVFNRIKKLDLPKSLETYLYHFPDCPMRTSLNE